MVAVAQKSKWLDVCERNLPEVQKAAFESVRERLERFTEGFSQLPYSYRLLLGCDPTEPDFRLIVAVTSRAPKTPLGLREDAGVQSLNTLLEVLGGDAPPRIHELVTLGNARIDLLRVLEDCSPANIKYLGLSPVYHV